MSIFELSECPRLLLKLLFLLLLLLLFSVCGDRIGDGDGEWCWLPVIIRLSHDFGELLIGLGSCWWWLCWWLWCWCKPAKDLTCNANSPLFMSRAWCSWAFARRHAMELFLKYKIYTISYHCCPIKDDLFIIRKCRILRDVKICALPHYKIKKKKLNTVATLCTK